MKSKQIKYKGYTLEGLESRNNFTVNLKNPSGYSMYHQFYDLDTWTSKRSVFKALTKFNGFEDAKKFIDLIEATSRKEAYKKSKSYFPQSKSTEEVKQKKLKLAEWRKTRRKQ